MSCRHGVPWHQRCLQCARDRTYWLIGLIATAAAMLVWVCTR